MNLSFVPTNWSKVLLGVIAVLAVAASLWGLSLFAEPRIARADSSLSFFDGFENSPQFSNPVWEETDPQWQVNGGDPHLGSKKAQVQGNTDTPSHPADDVLTQEESTAGYENIGLSFWYRYEGLDDGDSVTVEWYDGSSWNELETFEGEDGDDDDVDEWTEWSDDISGAANNSDFAFRFIAHLSAGNDKFFLDDVSLTGDTIEDDEGEGEDDDNATITIVKLIDEDGDPETTDDQELASGWEFYIYNDDEEETSGPYTTGENGSTGPIEIEDDDELTISEEQQEGYELIDAFCEGDEGEIEDEGWFDDEDGEIVDVELDDGDAAICTFINVPEHGSIQVTKEVTNNDDGELEADDFLLTVSDDKGVIDSGHGSVGLGPVPGTYYIGEEEEDGYELVSIACVDNDTEDEVSVNQETGAVTLNPGQDISCVVTNEYVPDEPAQCKNLLINGSFEEPMVTNTSLWQKFASVAGWLIQNISTDSATTLEVHFGWSGNAAADGDQYTELDGDHSTKITQSVATLPGAVYELSWAFAPRHNIAAEQNQLSVLINGSEVATEGPATGSAGLTPEDWTRNSHTFTASGTNTNVTFADAGPSNSFGTFLDDAKLCLIQEPEPEPEGAPYCGDDEVNQEWEQCELGEQGCTNYCTFENQCSDLKLIKVTLDDDAPASVSFDGTLHLGSAGNTIPNGTWFNFDEAGDDSFATIATAMGNDSGLAISRDTAGGTLGLAYRGGNSSGQIDYVQGTIETLGISLGTVNRAPDGTYKLEEVGGGFPDVFDVAGSNITFDLRADTGHDGVTVVVNEGEQYNCPLVAAVTMCKSDNEHNPLPGWTLTLLGDHVETVTVPSNGTEVFSSNSLDGAYAFVANGTYVYRPGAVGSTTDAAFSMRSYSGDPIDPTGHPYEPWVLVNSFPSPWEGYLGLTVDGALGTTDWGSIFNPLHEYALQYSGDGDPAGFKMVDTAYGDNSGSLTVDIYEGFAGVTNETGCVTFEDVPYGEYTAGELQQEGWELLYGPENPVVVEDETEEFVLVNSPIDDSPTLTIVKYLEGRYENDDEFDFNISGNDWHEDVTIETEDGVGESELITLPGSGTFEVIEEDIPEGWVLADVYCEYDGESFGEPIEDDDDVVGEEIYVEAGNHVTCYFTNVPEDDDSPLLTIVKYTDYVDGIFDFFLYGPDDFEDDVTIETVEGEGSYGPIVLGAGEGWYSLEEDVPEDWELENAYCEYASDEEDEDFQVSLNFFQSHLDPEDFYVEEGDHIICYFYNETDCSEGEYYDPESEQCQSREGQSYFDLSLTKEVEHDGTPAVGETVTYTITVTNSGDTTGNILVLDSLPSGVAYSSHTASNGDENFNPATGEWNIVNLGGEGNSATLAITVTINSGEEGQPIVNSAIIDEYDGTDLDTENNSDSASFTVEDEEESDGGPSGPVTQSFFGGGPTGLGGIGGLVLGASTGPGGGQILGESCGLYLNQHLRWGNPANDPEQVRKLQEFLNQYGYGNFTPTGYFGPLTYAAVKLFQLEYAANILTPWGITDPTGLVYLTTLRQLNLIECPSLTLDLPPLVPWQ